MLDIIIKSATLVSEREKTMDAVINIVKTKEK